MWHRAAPIYIPQGSVSQYIGRVGKVICYYIYFCDVNI